MLDTVLSKARDTALETLMDICRDDEAEREERRWAAETILNAIPNIQFNEQEADGD
jgi:hypothetical protein